MRVTKNNVLLPLLVLGLVAFVACGGGSSEPEETAAVEPGPAAPPEPPPVEDFDIDPGSLSAGGNVLDGSTDLGDNLLPPSAFGTIANLQVNSGNAASPVTRLTIGQSADPAKVLTLSVGADGKVSWSTETGAITAYDISTVSNDCGLMSQNLVPYFASGNSINFELGGTGHSIPLSGTNTVSFQITPDSDACGN